MDDVQLISLKPAFVPVRGSICDMPRRLRMTRNDGTAETNAERNSRPESWDALTYKRPQKLKVPCARVESDGEWFQIERVLDTVCLVGSDKGWQSLVQWKPNWSRQIHTSSALKDFHGRATVLGCVVKNDVLRSRVRRKIEWNHMEFMSCNFRVRIEHPDGSVTSEVMPYPDVKRRFPAALFEYMENRMPLPRVASKDEPRRDGLLSVYNNVNIPRCLYLHRKVHKEEREVEAKLPSDIQKASTGGVSKSLVKNQGLPSVVFFKEDQGRNMSSDNDVPPKDTIGKAKIRRRLRKRDARRSRGTKNRVLDRYQDPKGKPSFDKSVGMWPSNEIMNKTPSGSKDVQVKNILPPGISPVCAKEFLREAHDVRICDYALSQKSEKLSDTASKRRNGKRHPIVNKQDDVAVLEGENASKRRNGKRHSIVNKEDDVVVLEEVTPRRNGVNTSRVSDQRGRSVHSTSSDKSPSKMRRNGKRTSASKENHEDLTVILTSKNSEINSCHRTPGVKRSRRSSDENGKLMSCKRNTPLCPRNSLDHYFIRFDVRKIPCNGGNQHNISASSATVTFREELGELVDRCRWTTGKGRISLAGGISTNLTMSWRSAFRRHALISELISSDSKGANKKEQPSNWFLI